MRLLNIVDAEEPDKAENSSSLNAIVINKVKNEI